jgi:hypothetical protein
MAARRLTPVGRRSGSPAHESIVERSPQRQFAAGRTSLTSSTRTAPRTSSPRRARCAAASRELRSSSAEALTRRMSSAALRRGGDVS